MQLHVCGFETVAVVCDGSAPNLTMMKEMSGAPRKAFRCVDIRLKHAKLYTWMLFIKFQQ